MTKKLTQLEAIDRLQSVYLGKYDLSQVVFTGAHDKIIVVCKEHGPFSISYTNATQGKGCKLCANLKAGHHKVITQEQAIDKLKRLHGDTYDLSNVIYSGNLGKIKLGCKSHGVFEISFDNASQGRGCPACGMERSSEVRKTSQDEAIRRLTQVHGSAYDLSRFVYNGITEKSEVGCYKHGWFSARFNNLMDGTGCPICAKNGYKVTKPATFYILGGDNFIGFGITNDFKTRMSKHRTEFSKHGIHVELVKTFDNSGQIVLDLETQVKRVYRNVIVNTKVVGFKTEALPLHRKSELLDFCSNYIKTLDNNYKL